MSPHHVAVCSSATLTHHTPTQMGHSSSSIPKLSFCLIFLLVFPFSLLMAQPCLSGFWFPSRDLLLPVHPQSLLKWAVCEEDKL